jgi:putative transposase
MPQYRRNFLAAGTYFFTCVLHRRRPILTTALGRNCLRSAIRKVRGDHPFEILAIVLLPDHWHSVWTLPSGDARYPLRWMRIKEEFTKAWLSAGGSEVCQSRSRSADRLRGVWQKRYWEQTVRDEADLERCVDYAHWNPKKHKLVSRVRDWKWSSFHRFARRGEYDLNWGTPDPNPGWDDPEGEVQEVG